MKAGEILLLYQKVESEADEREALNAVLQALLTQVQKNIEHFKVKTANVYVNAYNQADDIWRSFCNKIPEKHFNPDGLVEAIKAKHAEVYNFLITNGAFETYIRRQRKKERLRSLLKLD